MKNIQIITNSLPIAEELADSDMDIILPGGILRKEMRSLIGPLAEKNLKEYFCNIAFIGVDSIDAEGIYTPNVYEAYLTRIMTQIAQKVIVVCDSSKFNRRSFVKISELKKIDILITDTGIPDEYISLLKELGVELVIA